MWQGIKKYDPQVVTMLMDFTWRTTADILRDAEARALPPPAWLLASPRRPSGWPDGLL